MSGVEANMQGFWTTWMMVWCGATLVLGLVMAGGAFPATDMPARLYYSLVSGFSLEPGFLDAAGLRFTVGVLGAVLIGWAIAIYALIAAADSAGAPAWRGLTASMASWFVIDCTISVLSGFPLNAAANTVFLVTYLVPVIVSGVLGQIKRAP
jgi:hypothetical protein